MSDDDYLRYAAWYIASFMMDEGASCDARVRCATFLRYAHDTGRLNLHDLDASEAKAKDLWERL